MNDIPPDDIPPLFCELDELSHSFDNKYECWREKARLVDLKT
jgi:hypothetical protein